MSFRTVVITKKSKLDYKMGYLVVRSEDQTTRVHLSEISVLMLETTAISLTAYLLAELSKQKIAVIFCDTGHNPYGELAPFYGTQDTSRKIREQIQWTPEAKAFVWAEIVRAKITGQMLNLPPRAERDRALLQEYASNVLPGDHSNREAHAAKIYFNSLFGTDFSRADDNPINNALNYGYSILLSAINREVAASGYLTQLGIFHDNMFNQFNLSCDLMEPFRPFVDKLVLAMSPEEFGHEEKMKLVNILNQQIRIRNQQHYLCSAIHIFVQSVWTALAEHDISEIIFPSYEL